MLSKLLTFVALLIVALVPSSTSQATEIWLAGVDPFVKAARHPGSSSDFMQLFQHGAPWMRAAQKVAVFKVSTQWLANAPDEELRQMIGDLRERHIALAMEGLMIPRGETCGQGVEGYSAPGVIGKVAKRVQEFGGDLAYIAMDEPFSGGYRFNGAHACRSSLPDLAAQLAENVNAVKAIFPRVRVGDIEVMRAGDDPLWISKLAEWFDVYQKVVGQPLAFFHADVDWANRGINDLRPLAFELRKRQIPLGIIYDGDPMDQTGLLWTQHAEERFDLSEGRVGLQPEQAILQTWMDQPEAMLPEDQPGTMTALVLSYSRTRTHLAAQLNGSHIHGQLTDDGGKPVAHASVKISLETDGRSGSPMTRELDGDVPANAATATFGLRLDAECDCHGDADFGIGPLTFSTSGGSLTRRFSPVAASSLIHTSGGAPGELAQFHASEATPVQTNLPPFPVVPGQRFKVSVSLRASTKADESGYLTIIFLDQNHKELQRGKILLQPAILTLADGETLEDGSFSYALPKLEKGVLWLNFQGSPKLRSTWTSLNE